MNQSSGLGVIVVQGAAASALLNVAFRPLNSSFLSVSAYRRSLHHRLSIILNRASHENVPLSIMIQSPTDKHGRSTVSSPNNSKSITLKNVHPLPTHPSLYLANTLYIHIYMYAFFFCLFFFCDDLQTERSRVNFLLICHDLSIGLSSADVLLTSPYKYILYSTLTNYSPTLNLRFLSCTFLMAYNIVF